MKFTTALYPLFALALLSSKSSLVYSVEQVDGEMIVGQDEQQQLQQLVVHQDDPSESPNHVSHEKTSLRRSTKTHFSAKSHHHDHTTTTRERQQVPKTTTVVADDSFLETFAVERRIKKKKSNVDDLQDDPNTIEHIQATTTVVNLQADDVTDIEADFFDATWITAFNSVYRGGDLTVLSVRLQDHKKRKKDKKRKEGKVDKDGDRRLRRPRQYFNYFDFFLIVDYRCRLCIPERRALKKSGDDNRNDEIAALHHAFERILCDALRDGPFIAFQGVGDCKVTFAGN